MADAEAWHELQSDPSIRQLLDWPVRGRAASRQHLRARTRHTLLWQSDDFLALAIDVNGILAGDVSLHLRGVRDASRILEIGWVLDNRHQGQGLAFEATDALLDFAFKEIKPHLIIAVIASDNHASRALAQRLGFLPASLDGDRNTWLLTRTEHALRQELSLTRCKKLDSGRLHNLINC